MIILCTRVQELERIQDFKSKNVLHKNHKKGELAVLFYSGLYLYCLLALQVVTTYELQGD